MGRLHHSALGVLLLVVLAAVAASSAAGAHRSGTALYTVEFVGNGDYARNASAPSACGAMSSTDSSAFDWDIVWKNVAITSKPDGGVPATGKLYGTTKQTFDGYDLSTAGCPKQSKRCAGEFGANEAKGASYPATVKIARKGTGYVLTVTVTNSPSNTGGWTECPSEALNESSEKYLAFGAPFGANGMVAPLSASEPFSAAELARSGKTTVNVRDTPKNYPGNKTSCNPTNAAGFVCTHKQSWSGHLIVTRTS